MSVTLKDLLKLNGPEVKNSSMRMSLTNLRMERHEALMRIERAIGDKIFKVLE